jgi:pyruvate-ferredoxin/flavodoxin oxidoreductase
MSKNKKASESESRAQPQYPGILTATDGTGTVVHAETNASEAAGAYPITPSTQMGEGWAAACSSSSRKASTQQPR